MHNNNNLIGEQIDVVELYGQLENEKHEIVEADVMLDLQRVGLCALTVVTKQRYENLILTKQVNELNGLDKGIIPEETEDTAMPYVVNEDNITPQLLDDKFLNHTVWKGLADCLVPQA